jgi:hypothetical protein
MKKCNTCNILKSLEEFSVNKAEKDARQRKCRPCSKKSMREYRVTNHALEVEKKAKWYAANRERVLNKSKKWNFENRAKINIRKYKRYHSDINFKLADILRSRVNKFLRYGCVFEALGCTLDELKAHLERQFQTGMSWDNWSKTGWHVDHIRPLSAFDLTKPAQFNAAVHYTNLQPLWASDNLSKHAKVG